jgi:hypothetical protein
MSGSSKCKSCDRPIVWCKMSSGKNMPLDPEPVADGNLVRMASVESGRAVFHAVVYRADKHEGFKRYRSHFVSCPQADQHRKRRGDP